VLGTANAAISHTNGTNSLTVIGVSNTDSSVPANQDNYLSLPWTLPSGTYMFPTSVHGLFYEASAGTFTYYLLGYAATGSCLCYELQLTLLFVPTAYGAFDPMLASAAPGGEKTVGKTLTAAEVAAQRASSEAANAARMRGEIDAMKERLAELETALKKTRLGQ
jgi:hypothetical protein